MWFRETDSLCVTHAECSLVTLDWVAIITVIYRLHDITVVYGTEI